jgi:probable H4MPT-linked C1 transfer pathway protein
VRRVLGWDVGGANLKAALVEGDGADRRVRVTGQPFEIWRQKDALPDVLGDIAAALGAVDATAVTMTAELSDAFRTKREGVAFVLDAVTAAARGPVRVFTTDGTFVDPVTARARWLQAAASNWMATAMLVAPRVGDAILVDIGSTTTDVIPLRDGRVAARGRTDPERMLAGELLYTGAVRTNVAAIVPRVPLWGAECPVAAESFATSGDVHVLLGSLDPGDYTGPTSDGRPAAPEFAAERLARVVCADVEMLGKDDVEAIASAVAEAQVAAIAAALAGAAGGLGGDGPVVATGLGAFLAHRAAARCGLASRDLSAVLGVDSGTAAPAVAVAWLLLDHTR